MGLLEGESQLAGICTDDLDIARGARVLGRLEGKIQDLLSQPKMDVHEIPHLAAVDRHEAASDLDACFVGQGIWGNGNDFH
jgi:hypothetical protein